MLLIPTRHHPCLSPQGATPGRGIIQRAGHHLRRLQAIFDEGFLRKKASRDSSGEHLGLLEVLIEVDLTHLAAMIGDLLLVPTTLPDEEPEDHNCNGHCDTEKEGKD
jgi:hypothetical protein